MKAIAVCFVESENSHRAKQLAARLQLPLTKLGNTTYTAMLCVTSTRLELVFPQQPHWKPLYVDFINGPLRHRRLYGGGRGQLIARAIGLKKYSHPRVIDLSAGLGRDGFVLADLGCEVVMLERSPIIAALVEDAIARASQQQWFQPLKLMLQQSNAAEFLNSLNNKPQIIYYDPMYPPDNKSALAKKEMRMLRQVVGDDKDSPQVLELALQHATHRVVVKRPRHAAAIAGPKPTLSYEGKSSRFDAYVLS